MSFMFEVIYFAPANLGKEQHISSIAHENDGRLDYREGPEAGGSNSIVLTYDFIDYDRAFAAAANLRKHGYKVDGPYDYGN